MFTTKNIPFINCSMSFDPMVSKQMLIDADISLELVFNRLQTKEYLFGKESFLLLYPIFGPRFEQAMQKKSELKVMCKDMDMTAQ